MINKSQPDWLSICKMHLEAAKLNEDNFFLFPLNSKGNDRFSLLPAGIVKSLNSADWTFPTDGIVPDFINSISYAEANREFFISGPSIKISKIGRQNDWQDYLMPILYKKVKATVKDDLLTLTNIQTEWSISPKFVDYLENKFQIEIKDSDVTRVIEKLESNKTNADPDEAFYATLLEILEIEDKEKKLLPHKSSWIIFSPPDKFNGFNVNIIPDYESIIENIEQKEQDLGGLSLISKGVELANLEKNGESLPFIPLNKKQQEALTKINNGERLVVISGPPGTGKSRVVSAALLNAWASGKRTLFTSKNNQAVKVVVSNLDKYDSRIPFYTYAGSETKERYASAFTPTNNASSFLSVLRGSNSENIDQSSLVERINVLSKKIEDLTIISSSNKNKVINENLLAIKNLKAATEEALSSINKRKAYLQTSVSRSSNDLIIEDFNNLLLKFKSWLEDPEFNNNHERLELAISENDRNIEDVQKQISIGLQEIDVKTKSTDTVNILLTDIESLIKSSKSEIFHAYKPVKGLLPIKTIDEADQEINNLNQLVALDNSLIDTNKSFNEIQAEYDTNEKLLQEKGILTDNIYKSLDKITKWVEKFQSWQDHGNNTWEKVKGFFGGSDKDYISSQENIPYIFENRKYQELVDASKETQTVINPEKFIETFSKYILETKALAELGHRHDEILGKKNSLNDSREVLLSQLGKYFNTEELLEHFDTDYAHPLSQLEKQRTYLVAEDKRKEKLGLLNDLLIRAKEILTPQNTLLNLLETLAKNLTPSNFNSTEKHLSSKVYNEFRIALKSIELLNSKTQEYLARGRTLVDEINRITDEHDNSCPNTSLKDIPIEELDILNSEIVNFLNQETPEHIASQEEANKDARRYLENAVANGDDEDKVYLEKFKSLEDLPELADLYDKYDLGVITLKIADLERQLTETSVSLGEHKWFTRMANNTENEDILYEMTETGAMAGKNLASKLKANFKKFASYSPVWISTLQSLRSIPLEKELFDLVIIDEATQCDLTTALPTIYRAKQLVVIGDSQQIAAITLKGEVEKQLCKKYDIQENSIYAFSGKNLYSTAERVKSVTKVTMLEEHFRSHPLIIGFSNQKIYNKSLKIKTPPRYLSNRSGKPIDILDVNGTADRFKGSWINRAEQTAVIDCVKRIKESELSKLDIGIITFFRSQSEQIKEQLSANKIFDPIQVGTVHSFQGDEKDIIILSTVLAPGVYNRTIEFIEAGKNILNVAFTRARQKVILVCNEQYIKQETGNRTMSDYLKHAEAIDALYNTSPLEYELYIMLNIEGIDAKYHQMIGDIEVDFLLDRNGKYLVVEVDGAQYHDDTKSKDSRRDNFLRNQGYDILRVKGVDIKNTPQNVIFEIKKMLGIQITG